MEFVLQQMLQYIVQISTHDGFCVFPLDAGNSEEFM